MLALFDVIWIFDLNTVPQKRKMYVCLDYKRGWFLRINTKAYPRPSIPILLADNPWLKHDSHVEGGILEIDEYEIDEAVANGICGRLNLKYREAVLETLLAMPIIKRRDKDDLRVILKYD